MIEAGLSHTCGVTTSGEGLCWGENSTGQLSVPADEKWIQLSTGTGHTCGVTTSGEGICWGSNANNRLNVPTGKKWAQISAGNQHTCGTTTSGEGLCWGESDGSMDDHGQVTAMPANKSWAQLSAGKFHTCGVTTSTEGLCWGAIGPIPMCPPFCLGQGQADIPAGKSWAQLSAGKMHTCGTTTTAEALCWGSNSDKQATVPTNLTRVDLAPAGFYRPGKDDIACPTGWTSRPGAITVLGCSIEILLCPLGQEWLSPNCTPCSPGKHRSLLSAPNCTACAKGRYQDIAGGVNCSTCSAGTFADVTGSTSASQCRQCLSGTFARIAGSPSCAPCLAGSYENASGSATCKPCSSGTFADATGSTSASQCRPCLAGRFASVAGSESCAPCLEGSYQDASGRCVLCSCFAKACVLSLFLSRPLHHATSLTFPLLHCLVPPPLSHSTQCKPCPNLTFANAKGLTRCRVCQAGTKYDGALLVSATSKPCASCTAGTYRDHNRSETDADNECAKCGLGKSSAASASTCTFCAPGKIGRQDGASWWMSCARDLKAQGCDCVLYIGTRGSPNLISPNSRQDGQIAQTASRGTTRPPLDRPLRAGTATKASTRTRTALSRARTVLPVDTATPSRRRRPNAPGSAPRATTATSREQRLANARVRAPRVHTAGREPLPASSVPRGDTAMSRGAGPRTL